MCVCVNMQTLEFGCTSGGRALHNGSSCSKVMHMCHMVFAGHRGRCTMEAAALYNIILPYRLVTTTHPSEKIISFSFTRQLRTPQRNYVSTCTHTLMQRFIWMFLQVYAPLQIFFLICILYAATQKDVFA